MAKVMGDWVWFVEWDRGICICTPSPIRKGLKLHNLLINVVFISIAFSNHDHIREIGGHITKNKSCPAHKR